jgi:NadR type nicotinamide-nucleotide adenylyltransferase
MKKVVILGPESTGKSTLCQLLAEHYKTVWCAEFARQYLLENGTQYSFDDLLIIAKGQLALEESTIANLSKSTTDTENDNSPEASSNLVIIDTDQYVMKVWCEYVFGDCHTWILNRVAQRPYDLYLLCKPDLPWVQDELREYPNEKPRQELYHIYKDQMINQYTPWVEISGNYDERLQKAISAIDRYL